MVHDYCADNECVRHPLVQLGRVPCFTAGDDAMAYDKTNYGRWLPHFWAMLSDLPAEQTQFVRYNFAQSMFGNPY